MIGAGLYVHEVPWHYGIAAIVVVAIPTSARDVARLAQRIVGNGR